MQYLSRNMMSATALKTQESDSIRFIENPKTGKLFFTCGTKQGAISPKVQEAYNAGSLVLEDMNYCEGSKDNGTTWCSCLMMASANVKATF